MENMNSYSETASEGRSLIDIIQHDFQLTHGKHKQLSELQEEIKELNAQRKILSKRKEFNDKCCIHCCCPFNLLFRRKLQCHDCHFWVCRSCVSWDNENKIWLCDVCEKQRILDSESWTWFYNHLKSRFKHFGRAKVLEGACRRRRTVESENDSGYGPCSDFKPALNIFVRKQRRSLPSSMADCASLEDCEDDDEDIEEEEEEAEIHHSIETIVEGLLGSTLDDASVDRVYPNVSEYEKLFTIFHGQLVTAVKNLSLSLKRALHNIPHDNDVTPTAAHAALKRLISALVRECEELPYMQSPENAEISADGVALLDVDMFSSYESLVASAIINKVVEDNQAKYFKHIDNFLHLMSHQKSERRYLSGDSISPENSQTVANSFTEAELPLECVQIEEIEEITREYTDSEDDKLSSISHHSSGLRSFDDLPISNICSSSNFPHLDENIDWKTPFPEFGQDLVEDATLANDFVTCYPTAVMSWEENWLFKKKKKLPLYSNLKYQLMTYCDDPPCMLIPFPSENFCSVESDEISSELSETHSVGSLEFSSDGENQNSTSPQSLELPLMTERPCEKRITALSIAPLTAAACIKSSEKEQMSHSSELIQCMDQTMEEVYPAEVIQQVQTDAGSDCNDGKGIQSEYIHANLNSKGESTSADVKSESCDASFKFEKHVSQLHINGKNHTNSEKILEEKDGISEDIFHIPTQPGTIAEREHKKWLNAVPLKNNPYSAENISRRYSSPNPKSLLNHVSSFEEFEKKLKDFSHSMSEVPVQTRLNCGLRSIDTSLYKRDYYVNNLVNEHKRYEEQFKSLPCYESINCESCDSIPEEALNSLEEKVYISAGKVFTLENHVKRLERELKDMGPSSDLMSSFKYCSQKVAKDEFFVSPHDPHYSSDNEENIVMPSVKSLATKFNFSDHRVENSMCEKLDMTGENVKIKKSRPCVKVHSLTARSLSREFRDRAKQNIPKPMNRIVTVPVQVSDDGTSEHESVSSAVSVSSPVCPPQNEIAHGYTSDESSTSTSSLPRLKTRRHLSRSILQRASYWERRAEQGLLSDASVSEEFPGLVTSHEA